jgi:LAO/AO transport system kinase
VVINKADIDANAALRAEAQITSALRLLGMHGHPDPLHHDTPIWHPKVIKISALLGQGVDAFWAAVTEFKTLQTANARFAMRREKQALAWMWERIEAGLKQSFREQADVQQLLPQLSLQVRQGQVAASTAARQLLAAYTDRFTVRAEPVEALSSSTTSPSTGSGRTGSVSSERTGG